MLELSKVAVTGGISSGKSCVSKIFSELGAYTIDSDKIVHQLLTPRTELGQKIIELLGSGIVDQGTINRARIAKKVFLNPKLLRTLEAMIHPLVYAEIENRYQEIHKRKNPPPLFIAEVPLLFESEGERFFDKTVAVVSDTEKCWERYRKSTGSEREEFNRRAACQLPPLEKAAKADYVIYNNGSPEDLQREVTKLFEELCRTKVK